MTSRFVRHCSRSISATLVFALLGICFGPGIALAKSKKPEEEKPETVDISATILYRRTGTLATQKEGNFTYQLEANIVQKMVRVPSDTGGRPAYFRVSDDAPIEGKVSGMIKLDGHAKVYDEATKKTYTIDAQVNGALSKFDEIYIESIRPFEPLSDGMTAEIRVHKKMSGGVHSDLPRMPNTQQADDVLLFPCGVANSGEEGLLSDGTIFVRPPLGPKPKDPMFVQVWELTSATYGMEDAPSVGGIRPPSFPAITEGSGDAWETKLKVGKDFVVMQDGGNYHDEISVSIHPIPEIKAK